MQSTHPKLYQARFYDPIVLFFYRRIARKLPASWFRPKLPALKNIDYSGRKLKLEIVSHCWQYSHLLAYQLSSYVLHPPANTVVTVTVFFSEEDTKTAKTLDFFSGIATKNVIWNWQAVDKSLLFRRAIGRNRAAFNTTADWVWYADCDLIFSNSVIDDIAAHLKASQNPFHFPGYEFISELLPQGDPTLREYAEAAVVDIDPKGFRRRDIQKAVGAFQIVRGDLLREAGYCNSIPLFQTPSNHWLKTYEDTIFRWLIGTDGEKLPAGGTYRIRHQEKGRYHKNSISGTIRKKVRSKQRYT